MTLPEFEVRIDADLDTADDDRKHFACAICHREGPAISYCGEPFVAKGVVFYDVPPDKCKACTWIADTTGCPTCY